MLRKSIVRRVHATLAILAAVVTVTITGAATQSTEAFAQSGQAIREIKVVGNKRIEPETVKSYLTFTAGQRYDSYKADESLRALFGTGLFQDVHITPQGGVVVVSVVENPIVNRVAFEGNKEVKSDTLTQEVQLKSRSIYTRARGCAAHSVRLPAPGLLCRAG
jgi:outer membrane protein insertion porin family